MLFKKKKRHEQEIRDLKEIIKDNFSRAAYPVKKNRRTLEANGITLEIKRAIGGHHV